MPIIKNPVLNDTISIVALVLRRVQRSTVDEWYVGWTKRSELVGILTVYKNKE